MRPGTLENAAALAAELGHAFIATADDRGWPHLAAAGHAAFSEPGHIVLAEWFCPTTVANLQRNPRLAVIVWDPVSDTGYQFLGELEEIKETSLINGFVPDIERKGGILQAERRLLVHVDRVLEFRRASHNDIEEA
ncbi:MAG: pyridoxamine 5'-phosphate oxidase family protein [Chloroflexi bacterium]|nr:pyridoxamine 5'-phosphate oxidase family protein [Chloroflexota bacterium]